MAHLVVILGAGASRACAPPPLDEGFRPPLTAELFDQRFAGILNHYPLAEAAAADIRVVVSSGALAIERFLRERLRESADPYARRRYLQIPLYLPSGSTARFGINASSLPATMVRLDGFRAGLRAHTRWLFSTTCLPRWSSLRAGAKLVLTVGVAPIVSPSPPRGPGR